MIFCVVRYITLGSTVALMALSTAALADGSAKFSKETSMETAKKHAPFPKPVVHQGIQYEQVKRPQEHGFCQAGGVIGAFNVDTRQKVWVAQIFTTTFDPNEERDAQEVYVLELKIDANDNTLLATDERGRHWRIQLNNGSVTQVANAATKK